MSLYKGEGPPTRRYCCKCVDTPVLGVEERDPEEAAKEVDKQKICPLCGHAYCEECTITDEYCNCAYDSEKNPLSGDEWNEWVSRMRANAAALKQVGDSKEKGKKGK